MAPPRTIGGTFLFSAVYRMTADQYGALALIIVRDDCLFPPAPIGPDGGGSSSVRLLGLSERSDDAEGGDAPEVRRLETPRAARSAAAGVREASPPVAA